MRIATAVTAFRTTTFAVASPPSRPVAQGGDGATPHVPGTVFDEYWHTVMASTPAQVGAGGARKLLLAAGAGDKVATFGEHVEKLHVRCAWNRRLTVARHVETLHAFATPPLELQ